MEEPVRKLMASLEALGFAPEEMIGELKEKKSLQKVASNTTKIVEHILSLSVASSEDLENSGGGVRLRLCLLALLAALVFEGIAQGQSNLRPLTLTSDLDLPTSRWIYDKAPLSKKSTKVVRLLRQLKEEEEKEAGKKCLDTVAALNRQAKSFRPWLVVTELRCAVMVAKGKERRYLTLVQALAKVDSNSSWLLHGPQVPSLREAYVEALMNLLKKELKANRRQAWKTIDRLNKIKGWLNKSQVGELYRYAGELAFIQQNLSLALDYYTRSFDVDPLSSVQKRLDSLKASLAKGKPGPPEPTVEVSPADVLEASGEENELYERIKTALGAGDLVAAVEDSVKLMEEFPGGRRSDWASDRVFEILSNLLSKSDSKYRLLKERVMDPMLKVAPGRQGEWARRLFTLVIIWKVCSWLKLPFHNRKVGTRQTLC